MLHLRTDWQGIQDTRQPDWERSELAAAKVTDYSTILPDEPVFMVRAKDGIAPGIVEAYADAAEQAGSDPEYCQRIRQFAQEMREYAAARREEGIWRAVHAPDAPALLAAPVG